MGSKRALLVAALVLGALLLIQTSALYAHASATYSVSSLDFSVDSFVGAQPNALFGTGNPFEADNKKKQEVAVQPSGFGEKSVQPSGFGE